MNCVGGTDDVARRGAGNEEEIRSAQAAEEAKSRRDVVHGYSAGDSFSRLCEFKGSSLKTGLPRGPK